MQNKKGLRYYIIVFSISLVLVLIYIVYDSIVTDTIDFLSILSLLSIPLFFTGMLMFFDFILGKLFPGKAPEVTPYERFLIKSTDYLKKSEQYEIEDFRKLRNNESFQRALKILFRIEEFGETNDANYKMLEKRFKKDSVEYKALKDLQELRSNTK